MEGEGYYHIRTSHWRILVWAKSIDEARATCMEHGEQPTAWVDLVNPADDYFFGIEVDYDKLVSSEMTALKRSA